MGATDLKPPGQGVIECVKLHDAQIDPRVIVKVV